MSKQAVFECWNRNYELYVSWTVRFRLLPFYPIFADYTTALRHRTTTYLRCTDFGLSWGGREAPTSCVSLKVSSRSVVLQGAAFLYAPNDHTWHAWQDSESIAISASYLRLS
jgi:hypothetical protein